MKRALLLAALLASCKDELKTPPADPKGGVSEYRVAYFFPVVVDTSAPPPNFFDIWGRNKDDLWISGENELVLHWDGKTWEPEPVPAETGLDPMDGCRPCDPGAGGAGTTCLPPPPDEPEIGAGGGGGAGGAGGSGGSGGVGGGGGIFEPPDLGPPDLRGIWAREVPRPAPLPGAKEDTSPLPLEIYAAGTQGTVVRRSGNTWTREPVVRRLVPADPTSAVKVDLDMNDVDGSGGEVVVVGQAGTVALRNPEFCRFEIQTKVTEETLNAVMIHGGNLTAVGNLGTIVTQSVGSDPNRIRIAGLTDALRALWGPNASRFYVVGLDGTLLRSTGDFPNLGMEEITGAPRVYLRDVWGTSMADVFIVGWSGTVAHFDGTTVKELLNLDPRRIEDHFTDQRLEMVLGFRKPPPKPPDPDDPPPEVPPPPPEGALITNAGTVYIGGVTSTLLQGP